MIKTKYFIDQTLKRNGNVTRLCLDFDSLGEVNLACLDLNTAFPHANHKAIKSTQLCPDTVKEIIEELN